jgi:hypothetical protein
LSSQGIYLLLLIAISYWWGFILYWLVFDCLLRGISTLVASLRSWLFDFTLRQGWCRIASLVALYNLFLNCRLWKFLRCILWCRCVHHLLVFKELTVSIAILLRVYYHWLFLKINLLSRVKLILVLLILFLLASLIIYIVVTLNISFFKLLLLTLLFQRNSWRSLLDLHLSRLCFLLALSCIIQSFIYTIENLTCFFLNWWTYLRTLFLSFLRAVLWCIRILMWNLLLIMLR